MGEARGAGRELRGRDGSTGSNLQFVSRLFTVVDPEAWGKMSKRT